MDSLRIPTDEPSPAIVDPLSYALLAVANSADDAARKLEGQGISRYAARVEAFALTADYFGTTAEVVEAAWGSWTDRRTFSLPDLALSMRRSDVPEAGALLLGWQARLFAPDVH